MSVQKWGKYWLLVGKSKFETGPYKSGAIYTLVLYTQILGLGRPKAGREINPRQISEFPTVPEKFDES